MNEPQFEAPTWKRIYNMLLKQASKIRFDGFQPDIIAGISRGGWIPARVLSDLLENSNLANARVEYYTGINETKKAPKLTQCFSTDVRGKTILIVDEVADSGESLKIAIAHATEQGAHNIKTATVYYKPSSTLRPNYYCKETCRWIVFPWEINETIGLIYKANKANPSKAQAELAKLSEAGVSKQLLNYFIKEFSDQRDAKTS